MQSVRQAFQRQQKEAIEVRAQELHKERGTFTATGYKRASGTGRSNEVLTVNRGEDDGEKIIAYDRSIHTWQRPLNALAQ
jgi:hypothetical protein